MNHGKRTHHSSSPLAGAGCALGAAVLFGASAPFAKLLLREVGVLPLSALLYLGAALSLMTLRRARLWRPDSSREAPLRGVDFILIAAITMLGGIAGSLLMLYGLKRISALAGALMLNLETPFTMLIAVAAFGEYLGPRELLAATLTIGGAVVLGWVPGELRAEFTGAGAIAAACLCWAVDNNLSQRLSLRDPAAVTGIKTFGAGAVMLGICFALGAPLPAAPVVAQALALGALCYGLSLYLAMLTLRMLGAAREAVYFASAPFIGALIAIPLFGRWPRPSDWIGGALMVAGVILLMREVHSHLHTHEELFHDHLHYHDEHHRHDHGGAPMPPEPHSHPHRHSPLMHSHAHLSDLHHRHSHRRHQPAGPVRSDQ